MVSDGGTTIIKLARENPVANKHELDSVGFSVLMLLGVVQMIETVKGL